MEICNLKSGSALLLAIACIGLCAMLMAAPTPAAFGAQAAGTAASNAARPVGTIKSISENNVILTTNNNDDMTVVMQDAAKLVQIEPGQKDLKEAVPIALKELLPEDRILVRR